MSSSARDADRLLECRPGTRARAPTPRPSRPRPRCGTGCRRRTTRTGTPGSGRPRRTASRTASDRQVERVAVPLQRQDRALEAAHDRVDASLVGQLDGQDARPRARARRTPSPRGSPPAAARRGTPRSTARRRGPRRRSARFSSTSHGSDCLVVDAHRPAHRDDRVEPVGSRGPAPISSISHVAIDPAALAHHLRERARGLAGDVLEDERAHGPGYASPSRASPSRCRSASTGTLDSGRPRSARCA